MNLPNWVTQIQQIWFAIGAFLVVLATQGVGVPAFLIDVFSEEIFNALLGAIGAVLTFVQVIRNKFASESDGEVQVLSKNAWVKYLANPFKVDYR